MRPTTLVTQDPSTGLRHNPIRYPNSTPPNPYGCRWCGINQNTHGRRWVTSAGLHAWQRPTNTQILARMQARRTARLNAVPPKYHATTRYSGTPGDPDDEGTALCADCGTDACSQYQRIQYRLAISLTDLTAQAQAHGGWGSGVPF